MRSGYYAAAPRATAVDLCAGISRLERKMEPGRAKGPHPAELLELFLRLIEGLLE